MNPTHILRVWREREVRLYQPFSLAWAEALLAVYLARGWSGSIEERV